MVPIFVDKLKNSKVYKYFDFIHIFSNLIQSYFYFKNIFTNKSMESIFNVHLFRNSVSILMSIYVRILTIFYHCKNVRD